jgi:hypothetical protein
MLSLKKTSFRDLLRINKKQLVANPSTSAGLFINRLARAENSLNFLLKEQSYYIRKLTKCQHYRILRNQTHSLIAKVIWVLSNPATTTWARVKCQAPRL